MRFGIELAVTVRNRAFERHVVLAVVQYLPLRVNMRRQRHRMHEIHAELNRDHALVVHERRSAHGRIGQRHEHAAVDDAVKIRMLLLDIELQTDLTVRRRHDLRVNVFNKWILMIKIDDFLLQLRHLLHAAIPFLWRLTVPSRLKAGWTVPTGVSACAPYPAHNDDTSAYSGFRGGTHRYRDRQPPSRLPCASKANRP